MRFRKEPEWKWWYRFHWYIYRLTWYVYWLVAGCNSAWDMSVQSVVFICCIVVYSHRPGDVLSPCQRAHIKRGRIIVLEINSELEEHKRPYIRWLKNKGIKFNAALNMDTNYCYSRMLNTWERCDHVNVDRNYLYKAWLFYFCLHATA
jgi:hypothetical protein